MESLHPENLRKVIKDENENKSDKNRWLKMGAKIAPAVVNFPISQLLQKNGCVLLKGPGKVSELRVVPNHPDLVIILTLPRKSIYDFPLGNVFEGTEEVITALTVLIEGVVLKNLGIPTHLVAYGKGIDQYLPEPLRNNAKLQKCVFVARKLPVSNWEYIYRFCHTGSAVKSLNETGKVYGHTVEKNIKEGKGYKRAPLDTPTTKAETGHDKPLTRAEVTKRKKHNKFGRWIAVNIYDYFIEKGIIAADLKLELSKEIERLIYMLDKFGPDEARFWDLEDWELAIKGGRMPKSMDKEILRIWGKGVPTPFIGGDKKPIIGLNKLDPDNEDHIVFVQGISVPPEVIQETIKAYFELFRRANNGKPLEDFQREVMGIAV